MHEINLLVDVDHINIINIFEYYIYTQEIYIVMEYLDGGELIEKLVNDSNHLNENSIRQIMNEILSAIAYLHSKGIGNQKYFIISKSRQHHIRFNKSCIFNFLLL